MSKTGGGCIAGLIIVGVVGSDIGLILFFIFGVSVFGGAIGEHDNMLTMYIVIGMIASYIVPLVAFIASVGFGYVTENILFPILAIPIIAVYMFVASWVFMFPSSFVADSGCKAGNDRAVWAMRTIPMIWGFETFYDDGKQKMYCTPDGLAKHNG